MGISLAICSSIHHSGKSVLAFLLAHRLSRTLKKETNILICCTCMADGNIREIVGVEDDYFSLEDLINAGAFAYDLGMDTNGLLYNSGNVFLIDTIKATPSFVKKNAARYQELFKHLKKDFDLIITDTSSDSTNPLTQYILETCDHILNIAVQDVLLLEKKPFTASKDTAHIINRYTDIYPDKKELSRLLRTKNILTLPYCSQLQEMKNRHKLYQYAGFDTEYIKAMDKLAGYLVETLNLPKQEKNKGKKRSKNSSFINLLKKGGKQ